MESCTLAGSRPPNTQRKNAHDASVQMEQNGIEKAHHSEKLRARRTPWAAAIASTFCGLAIGEVIPPMLHAYAMPSNACFDHCRSLGAAGGNARSKGSINEVSKTAVGMLLKAALRSTANVISASKSRSCCHSILVFALRAALCMQWGFGRWSQGKHAGALPRLADRPACRAVRPMRE